MNKKLWIIIVSGLVLCSLLALMQWSGARNAASGNGSQNQPLPIQLPAPIPVPQPPEAAAGSVSAIVVAAPVPAPQLQPQPAPVPQGAESDVTVKTMDDSATIMVSVVLLPLTAIAVMLVVSGMAYLNRPHKSQGHSVRRSIVARGALS